jgi:hypothetical protein
MSSTGRRLESKNGFHLTKVCISRILSYKKTMIIFTGQQKARFVAITNSRPPAPPESNIPDEGVFNDLPNGDCLETGHMYDPSEGRIRSYKEVWRDLLTDDTAHGFILQMEKKEKPSQAGSSDVVLVDAWIAKMGTCQLAIGQFTNGEYGAWIVFPSNEPNCEGGGKKSAGNSNITQAILPIGDEVDATKWKVDDIVTIDRKNWVVKDIF